MFLNFFISDVWNKSCFLLSIIIPSHYYDDEFHMNSIQSKQIMTLGKMSMMNDDPFYLISDIQGGYVLMQLDFLIVSDIDIHPNNGIQYRHHGK